MTKPMEIERYSRCFGKVSKDESYEKMFISIKPLREKKSVRKVDQSASISKKKKVKVFKIWRFGQYHKQFKSFVIRRIGAIIHNEKIYNIIVEIVYDKIR